MKRDELFRIWDATNPTFDDIKAYLDRFCGTTPLELAFKDKNGNIFYQNTIDKNSVFLGVVVDGTIFYSRGFTQDDMYHKDGVSLRYEDLSVGDVTAWIRETDIFPKTAHLVREVDCAKLEANRQDFTTTVKILKHHGIEMPKFCRYIYWFNTEYLSSTTAHYWDGHCTMQYYLDKDDYWICSNKL